MSNVIAYKRAHIFARRDLRWKTINKPTSERNKNDPEKNAKSLKFCWKHWNRSDRSLCFYVDCSGFSSLSLVIKSRQEGSAQKPYALCEKWRNWNEKNKYGCWFWVVIICATFGVLCDNQNKLGWWVTRTKPLAQFLLPALSLCCFLFLPAYMFI